jgi:hypothetical protein
MYISMSRLRVAPERTEDLAGAAFVRGQGSPAG